jgi:hypothetical protein
MTNLCRDEVTAVLKANIESVFGSSFNTNGLGGVLTCGVTGMGAGLSHSPVCPEGRERYVFFAFPHCAVDEAGKLGAISRPNRPGESCACGAMAAVRLLACFASFALLLLLLLLVCFQLGSALLARTVHPHNQHTTNHQPPTNNHQTKPTQHNKQSLGQFQAQGIEPNCRVPGVHDPLDPEFSILKQRLARRIKAEGLEPAAMNLADITSVAERVISDVSVFDVFGCFDCFAFVLRFACFVSCPYTAWPSARVQHHHNKHQRQPQLNRNQKPTTTDPRTQDLEYLISKAVDINKADYAVITGVQVHNWSTDLEGANFEFVAPTKCYVVVAGEKTEIDLEKLPPLTPRQLNVIAGETPGLEAGISSAGGSMHTLQSMSAEYLTQVICSAELSKQREFTLAHRPLSQRKA